jgi:hypothetical protein
MKKLLLMLLVFLLFCNIAFAETSDSREMTSDEQAYNIYLDIAHVYEYGVRYLEELGRVWEISLNAKDVDAVNKLCYMDCFTQEPLSSLYEMYLGKYGYSIDEIRQLSLSRNVFAVSEKTDLIWSVLELEVEAKYVETPAALKVYLDRAMSNIRSLMSADREYPFLSELQAYYKDAVMLYEYIAEFKDNYSGFTGKLDTYRTNKSSWEIDFEFIFDPSGYAYVEEVRKAQQDEAYKTIYERAVAYETDGDYESARENYWLCSSYEDAFDRMQACAEKINAEIAAVEQAEEEAERAAYEQDLALRREKYKHLDAHTGKYPQPFSCGLSAMNIDGFWCYVDTTGSVVLHDEWTHVTTFVDGTAWVAKDNVYAKIDVYGNYLEDYKYTYEHINSRSYKSNSGGITYKAGTGFVNGSGEVIAYDSEWSNAWAFNDGYAFVLKNGKWGVIDKNGNLVIPHEYSGGNYGEGYFILIKDNVLHIYDELLNQLF